MRALQQVGSFCFGAVLNRGGFGVVRCGYCNTSGEPVAAKIMSLKVAIDLKNEIVLQSALRHPNVVALKDIIIERDQARPLFSQPCPTLAVVTWRLGQRFVRTESYARSVIQTTFLLERERFFLSLLKIS